MLEYQSLVGQWKLEESWSILVVSLHEWSSWWHEETILLTISMQVISLNLKICDNVDFVKHHRRSMSKHIEAQSECSFLQMHQQDMMSIFWLFAN